MKTPAEIRDEWIKTLFSTLAADRPRAEAAVVDLYLAAGFEKPGHLLWFDSPLQASWAVALLLKPRSPVWHQLLDSTERTLAGRKLLDDVRRELCRQTGLPSWDGVLSTVGQPLGHHWVQPDFSRGFPKMLQTEIQNARIHLYGDVSKLFVAPSDSDDLCRAEQQLFAGARGILANLSEWHSTNSIRSTSFLADYSLAKMASDEAEAASRPVPPTLDAAWRVARSAGLWWPFANAAFLSDRPSEIHHDDRFLLHRADGPALVYRDGTKVYAWHGMNMREHWILQAQNLTASELKQLPSDFRKHVETQFGKPKAARKKAKFSDLLKADLPANHEARLRHLREHAGGSLPHLERYLAGEHVKVWSELVALGPAVREEPNAADALAVAYETMRRVAANVRTVVARLQKMKYEFRTAGMTLDAWTEKTAALTTIDPVKLVGNVDSPHLQRLLSLFNLGRDRLANQVEAAKHTPRDRTIRAHVPPGKQVRKQIARLEKMVGPFPLSLRAFYEVVGAVDWIGTHPSLAPESSDICPDPLVVFPIEDALEEAEQGLEEGEGFISIAPDDLHKADTSGGDPYQISVPDPQADGELLNERHQLLFIDYLRLCFRFGGFPGYEGIDRGVPPEIAALAEGLVDF